jgi:hypothetical protein
MKDWFASFITHLNPNTERWSDIDRPEWPVYLKSGEVLSVNYTQIGAVSDVYYDNNPQCAFFWDNGNITQN